MFFSVFFQIPLVSELMVADTHKDLVLGELVIVTFIISMDIS